MVRYKARLVAQRYNQEEGTNFDEILTLMARLEAIRMLSAFVYFKKFQLFQIRYQEHLLE